MAVAIVLIEVVPGTAEWLVAVGISVGLGVVVVVGVLLACSCR